MYRTRLAGWLICTLLVLGVGGGLAAGMPAAGRLDLAPAPAASRTAAPRAETPTATVTPTATAQLAPAATAAPARATATAAPPALPVHPPADVTATTRVAAVPILMYHYISTPPRNADKYRLDLAVPPDRFEQQLRYLADNGYASISLYQLVDHLSTGAPLPPRPVVLTFDDGYRDAYEHAFPLLVRYGFSATFFIVTDYVNNNYPEYLTWPMVQEMSAAGMSIESHSRTHPDLRGRSFEALVWQLLGPIEAITAYTGRRPHFFCYPSGRYDGDAIAVLKSVDTWAGVTTESGRRQTLATAMTWPRLRVHGGGSLADFARLVE